MSNRETKRQRMEVRKDIGNRIIEPPSARPKGPDFLMPSACFSCHKSWKLHQDSKGICPECGAKLAAMGRNFSAPKKGAVEQWKKVELLWQAGFRFVGSTDNYNASPMPDSLQEVHDFIRENPDHPFRLAKPRDPHGQ